MKKTFVGADVTVSKSTEEKKAAVQEWINDESKTSYIMFHNTVSAAHNTYRATDIKMKEIVSFCEDDHLVLLKISAVDVEE